MSVHGAETRFRPYSNGGQQSPVRRGASQDPDAALAVADLKRQLDIDEIAFVLLFVSPEHDLDAVSEAVRNTFGGTTVIGCTTAGEITPEGYATGSIAGISFCRSHFSIATMRIDRLDDFKIDQGPRLANELMARLEKDAGMPINDGKTFAMLLADGLSRQEEALVSSLASGLGAIPLFGGSAGDGLKFEHTFILHEGRFRENVALLSLVRTDCAFNVFKLDHFEPTERKMVVTGADPDRRLVTEINAEPAAPEYAKMVGLDARELSPFVFAAYPVVVRVGGEYHVRSIQKVEEDGSLQFYCAIDEGLVMTVARGRKLVDHLDESFRTMCDTWGNPMVVIGFDCILRRLEVEQHQQNRVVSEIMRRNRVLGFCTYGEQYKSMHVNQTFTGVFINDTRSCTS